MNLVALRCSGARSYPDPRVKKRIEDVRKHVEENSCGAGDQEEGHDRRRVHVLVSPVRNISPMPFQPKTDSVMTAPPIRPAKSKAAMVAIGISALRKAWRKITVRSLRPLERAVRM